MKDAQQDISILKDRYERVSLSRIEELMARRSEVQARIKANEARNQRQLAERSLYDTLADIRQGIVVSVAVLAIFGTAIGGNALLNMGCEHVGVITHEGRVCL